MSAQTDFLLSTTAIRERCLQLFELTKEGQTHFDYHPEKWDSVVEFVYQTILENYPDLNIPFHSRLAHFRPGGINRLDWIQNELSKLSATEKARTLVDLIIPSVLLDAGAGNDWKFQEARTQQAFNRSEGLGVASFHMFLNNQFSTLGKLQTDALALKKLTAKDIETAFQVSESNPLVGVEGRLHLLQKLGDVVESHPDVFKNKRPGDLVDHFIKGNQVNATDVLDCVLKYLGGIWPSRLTLDGVSLGDTWSHPSLGPTNSFESMVPFHKLSQWLSYSLLDAMLVCGLEVTGVEKLTGLPEYRNGGLFLDLGLITVKDLEYINKGITPEMSFTIEWRALTVILLDELAHRIQIKLNKNAQDFPLAKVLEGGSWWAGRKIAAKLRPGGTPPIKIISDGTVF